MQAPDSSVPFTPFDYLLIAIMLFSAVLAFIRGFIKAALSICGLVFGVLIASWEYLVLAMMLSRWITRFEVAEVVSFLLILVLVMVLFAVVAKVLSKTVAAIGLGFLDRLMGALFGLARGAVFGIALTVAITAFLPASSWLENSQLAPYFLAGFHEVSFVVPQHFQDQIAAGAKSLLHAAPDVLRPDKLPQHR